MFGDSLEPVPRSYDKIWAAVEMIIYFVHFETLNIVLFLLQVFLRTIKQCYNAVDKAKVQISLFSLMT